jgi:hypothetical protein
MGGVTPHCRAGVGAAAIVTVAASVSRDYAIAENGSVTEYKERRVGGKNNQRTRIKKKPMGGRFIRLERKGSKGKY